MRSIGRLIPSNPGGGRPGGGHSKKNRPELIPAGPGAVILMGSETTPRMRQMTDYLLLSILLALTAFGAGASLLAYRSAGSPTRARARATSLPVSRVSLRSGLGDASVPPASIHPVLSPRFAAPCRLDRGQTWPHPTARSVEPAFELHLVLCHRRWASFGTPFRLRERRAEEKTKNAIFRALRPAEHGVRFPTYAKGGCVMRLASLAGAMFASALWVEHDRSRATGPTPWCERRPPHHRQPFLRARLRC